MHRLKYVISMILSICLINTCFGVNVFADEVQTPPPEEETTEAIITEESTEESVTLEPVAELTEEVEEPIDESQLEIEVQTDNVDVEIINDEEEVQTETEETIVEEELSDTKEELITEETVNIESPMMLDLSLDAQGLEALDKEAEVEEKINPACTIDFSESKFTYKTATVFYDPEDMTYKINNDDAGWYVAGEKTNYYYITIVNTGDVALTLNGSITQANENSPIQFYLNDVKELESQVVEVGECVKIKVSVVGDYVDGCDMDARVNLKLEAIENQIEEQAETYQEESTNS